MEMSTSLTDYNYIPLDAIEASPKSRASTASIAVSTEISLFPMLDLWLMILPTYYTTGRNKCLNALMIGISMIILLSLPIFLIFKAIISGFEPNDKTMIIDQLFVFTLYFFPFCCGLARLYFFAKHFDFKIWHYQPIPLSSNRLSIVSKDNNPSKSSHLLCQSAKIKSNIRKQLRIGAFTIFILYSLFTACGTWTSIVFYSINITDKKEIKAVQYEQIIWYSLNYLFSLLPDLLMLCVTRLYFTECYLNILAFTQSINVITSFSSKSSPLLDDIISFDIHSKYLKMYHKISTICNQLNYFVMFWVITMTFVYWFLITLCFFTDWRSVNINIAWSKQLSTPIYLQLITFAIQAFVAALFMLWPAFKMTELFKELKDKITQQIQMLLKDRAYLHDERLLNKITENSGSANMNMNINTTDLHKYISVYSKQKACLEILSQVKLTMHEKQCAYKLLGLSLDRYSIRDFVVALLMGKIISYLWNVIN